MENASLYNYKRHLIVEQLVQNTIVVEFICNVNDMITIKVQESGRRKALTRCVAGVADRTVAEATPTYELVRQHSDFSINAAEHVSKGLCSGKECDLARKHSVLVTRLESEKRYKPDSTNSANSCEVYLSRDWIRTNTNNRT